MMLKTLDKLSPSPPVQNFRRFTRALDSLEVPITGLAVLSTSTCSCQSIIYDMHTEGQIFWILLLPPSAQHLGVVVEFRTKVRAINACQSTFNV